MSNTIDQYKTPEQLRELAEAQQKIITQLSKQKQNLQEEVAHLKSLLEKTVPIIGSNSAPIDENDAEQICNLEIAKLKLNSVERELTLEECRKLETYFKILQQIKNTPDEKNNLSTKKTSAELLKIVENDVGNK